MWYVKVYKINKICELGVKARVWGGRIFRFGLEISAAAPLLTSPFLNTGKYWFWHVLECRHLLHIPHRLWASAPCRSDPWSWTTSQSTLLKVSLIALLNTLTFRQNYDIQYCILNVHRRIVTNLKQQTNHSNNLHNRQQATCFESKYTVQYTR